SEHQERHLAAEILEVRLLGEKIAIESLDRSGAFPGRREEKESIFESPDREECLDLAVDVEAGGGDAAAGGERLDVVAQHRVQEGGAIPAGDFGDAEIAAGDEPDASTAGCVLPGGVWRVAMVPPDRG